MGLSWAESAAAAFSGASGRLANGTVDTTRMLKIFPSSDQRPSCDERRKLLDSPPLQHGFFDAQLDTAPISFSSGIRILHQIANGKYHLIQKRLRLPQQSSMRNSAPDNLPQHVAAAIICWKHSIRNQKRRRSRVVGDHPQRSRRLRAALLCRALYLSDVPVNSAARLISGVNKSVS